MNWDLVIAAALGALVSGILVWKASFWIYNKLHGDTQVRMFVAVIIALDHEIEYAKELGHLDLVGKLQERRRAYAKQRDELL